MSVTISQERLAKALRVFKKVGRSEPGGPFTSFRGCGWFSKEEYDYKIVIHRDARKALQLEEWNNSPQGSGEICQRVVEAFERSGNLIEHRWGDRSYEGWSQASGQVQRQVERLTADLMVRSHGLTEIGSAFDQLCDYLREHSQPCQWPPMAYLLFLRDRQQFFPIHPGKFQKLLGFLGVEEQVSGYVSWDRYRVLMGVATALEEYLSPYDPREMLDIQGFMYVVGDEIAKNPIDPQKLAHAEAVDYSEELRRRQRTAARRERVGLHGEQFVLESERQGLEQAGKTDLAACVEHVAVTGSDWGYDVRSFTANGDEIHIEVKATERSDQPSFVLSQSERQRAEQDSAWSLHMVRLEPGMDTGGTVEDFGNVVLDDQWDLQPRSWQCRRKDRDQERED